LAVLPSGDKTQPYKPTFLLNICHGVAVIRQGQV
jgi:hypothetical protein